MKEPRERWRQLPAKAPSQSPSSAGVEKTSSSLMTTNFALLSKCQVMLIPTFLEGQCHCSPQKRFFFLYVLLFHATSQEQLKKSFIFSFSRSMCLKKTVINRRLATGLPTKINFYLQLKHKRFQTDIILQKTLGDNRKQFVNNEPSVYLSVKMELTEIHLNILLLIGI